MAVNVQLIVGLTSYYGFDVLADAVRSHEVFDFIESMTSSNGANPLHMAMLPMGTVLKNGKGVAGYYHCVSDLKKNIEVYEWLNTRFEDDASREVFYRLMLYRLFPDPAFIKNAYDSINPQYFDKSIITTDENEIFVDCGAFTGDSALSYINNCGEYKRMYLYDPLEKNALACLANLAKYENIVIRNVGVGAKNDEIPFFISDAADSHGGFAMNAGRTEKKTEIVSLDEDIDEPVTFIKMDVEGFEMNALRGAVRHIQEDKPKLAISLYHLVDDFWQIPKLIDSMNPDYRFFLRHYDENQNFETVLYAVM